MNVKYISRDIGLIALLIFKASLVLSIWLIVAGVLTLTGAARIALVWRNPAGN